MNEKEIKAIELLKKIRFSSDEYYIVDGAYAKNIDYILILNAIETVLNLIEKQQYIIEGKECVIETQAHNEEVLNKIIDEKQAELELQTLLEDERRKQLEQKDRIITYMTLYIGDNIDEEHCKKTIGNGKCENYGQCLECIKEYFENKVKESK